jgi:hypothetical protein
MITITLLVILGTVLALYCGVMLLKIFTGIALLFAAFIGIFISIMTVFFSMLLMLIIFSMALLSALVSLFFSFLVF